MKVFKEEQQFNQPLVYVGLSIATIVSAIPVIKEWDKISHLPIGQQLGALSGLIILGLVILWFFVLKLVTRIDEKGILFRFKGFHLKPKIITWNEINKAYIRKYDAMTEYGGWGIKGGLFWIKSKGKAYNVKGNIGLQLELKNGKKILIGTQKKEEMERVLKMYEAKIQTL